jgi:hypothetical protein
MSDQSRKTWFNYTALSGIGTKVTDDASRVLCSMPIQREQGLAPIELAIIGSQSKLELIRVGTPDGDGELSPEEIYRIDSITDHAISVIRLLYNFNVDLWSVGGNHLKIGQHSKDDGSPQLSLDIKTFAPPGQFDGKKLKEAISATLPIRVLISLLAQAQDPITPVVFKYLCLYKILELELKTNGYWVGLEDHLSKYENSFRELNISGAKLKNFLHNYRDKCAHIKIGSRDEIGLTGIGSKDGTIVTNFMPLFHRVVTDLVNKRYSDKVRIDPPAEIAHRPITNSCRGYGAF